MIVVWQNEATLKLRLRLDSLRDLHISTRSNITDCSLAERSQWSKRPAAVATAGCIGIARRLGQRQFCLPPESRQRYDAEHGRPFERARPQQRANRRPRARCDSSRVSPRIRRRCHPSGRCRPCRDRGPIPPDGGELHAAALISATACAECPAARPLAAPSRYSGGRRRNGSADR